MPIAIAHRPKPDPHRAVRLNPGMIARRKQRTTAFRTLLQGRGVNLTQLARMTGFSHSYISRIVDGRRTPSLRTTVDLAVHLGIGLVEMAEILLQEDIPDGRPQA